MFVGMEYANFPRINGEHNFTGYNAFYFIPKSKVTAIGDVINGNVATITTTGDWFVGYSIQEKLLFKDEPAIDKAGVFYPITLSGTAPVDKPEYLAIFDLMVQDEFIVLLKDNNGRYKLLGTLEKGLRFIYKTEGVGYVYTFSGDYNTPPPFFSGTVTTSTETIDALGYLPIIYNYFQQTGQTTIYIAGDDASQEATYWGAKRNARPVYGRAPKLVNFDTLHSDTPNAFGNTLRFTDINGVTTSGANKLIIDHYTGLAWYNASAILNNTLAGSIAAANAATYGGFSDWKIPTRGAIETLIRHQSGQLDKIGILYGAVNTSTRITALSNAYQTNSTFYYSTISGINSSLVICRAFY